MGQPYAVQFQQLNAFGLHADGARDYSIAAVRAAILRYSVVGAWGEWGEVYVHVSLFLLS